MKRPCIIVAAMSFAAAALMAKTPRATVRASAPNTMSEMRRRVVGGRYELRNASTVDLIRTAWNVQPDEVTGGPEWVDERRFDVVVPVPLGAGPQQLESALQTLLEQRFRLVTHRGTREVPVFALTVENATLTQKSFRQSADDSALSDCRSTAATASSPVRFECRNMSLAKFAERLPRLRASGYLFTYRVIDRTGMQGNWDFSAEWTPRDSWRAVSTGETVTVFDAMQQLGLKLAMVRVSEPAIVIDKGEPPMLDSPNPAAAPRFEVAEIKPDPGAHDCSNVAIQPGGRVHIIMTLKGMIQEAWGDMNPRRIVGASKATEATCYEVLAKAAIEEGFGAGWNGPVWNGLDLDTMRQMLRNLLVERFKLQAHMDERVIDGYVLTAAKPKLRAANPARRPGCGAWLPDDDKDPRLANPVASNLLTCHNATMQQFAGAIYDVFHSAPPIVDETGLTGRFDFSIHFTPPAAFDAITQPAAAGAASEPNGAISIFEAITSQIGLKLQSRRMPGSVLVIDSVNLTPAEN